MRRAQFLPALTLAAGAVVGACGSEGSPREASPGDVYEAVLRWFASADPSDPEPLAVFVEPRGEGATIELDTQAAVVAATEDVAEVRFIDDESEALHEDEDTGETVVRDDGVLLRLGPVVQQGSRVELDVDRWVDEETVESMRFLVLRRGDRWVVQGEPEDLPPSSPT